LTHTTFQITTNVWAILTYEDAWNSYINNYVIAKGNHFVLIDTNLRKHRSYVQQALQEIGAVNDAIECVYCTHRHPDHIGNVEIFPSRNNWIHLDDFFELDDFSQTLFGHTFTGSKGKVPHLFFHQLPSHTAGSVAFFDPESKVCFTGDHLSFYGEPLGAGIGYEAERRSAFLKFVKKWKIKHPDKVKGFAEGIRLLSLWPSEYLATGHGTVLKGEIQEFLRQVLQVVTT